MKYLFTVLLLVISNSLSTSQQKAGCHSKQADIIFLLDSSTSLSFLDFQTEKNFISTFTNSIQIGPNDVQIGVVNYASNPETEIELRDSKSATYVQNLLNNIQYHSGGTGTDKALKYVLESEFKSIKGNRLSALDYVVVLTDGISNNGKQTYYQAQRLHNAGVTVYAIGIGSHINTTELSRIATDKSHMFVVPDFNALSEIQNELHPIACNSMAPITTPVAISTLPANPCSSSPCRFGKCYDDDSTYVCICQTGYHGKNCDQDMCSDMPCKNGGQCYRNANDYVCICHSGFSGKNCENAPTARPDVCSSHPCWNNGRCFQSGSDFVCQCQNGFSGKNCQIAPTQKPDVCSSLPCQNNGRCFRSGGDYICQCSNGFSGKNCQVAATPKPGFCASQPCLNGGRCFEDANGYICTCAPNYIGRRCSSSLTTRWFAITTAASPWQVGRR